MLRAAMTQTVNAYASMPDRVEDLHVLADTLDDVRQANLDHHAALIGTAAAAGVGVVGLGELFPMPYFSLGRDPMWLACAESATNGPSVRRMREVAAAHGVVIVAPIFESCDETGSRYNTAVIIDADGSIKGRFRKSHIPAGTNEQGTFDEAFYYGPADGPCNEPASHISGGNPLLPVFSTSVGRIGVSICYDRHFPRMAEGLARAGAQVIFSPAVTFGEKSQRMWEIEFECDAARHNVFIGGSNRLGCEKPWNQPYFGASYFVGPNGRCENISTDPNLVIADLDLDTLDAPDPSGWNLQRDRNSSIDG